MNDKNENIQDFILSLKKKRKYNKASKITARFPCALVV
jgi:hypothetical protein